MVASHDFIGRLYVIFGLWATRRARRRGKRAHVCRHNFCSDRYSRSSIASANLPAVGAPGATRVSPLHADKIAGAAGACHSTQFRFGGGSGSGVCGNGLRHPLSTPSLSPVPLPARAPQGGGEEFAAPHGQCVGATLVVAPVLADAVTRLTSPFHGHAKPGDYRGRPQRVAPTAVVRSGEIDAAGEGVSWKGPPHPDPPPPFPPPASREGRETNEGAVNCAA